MKGPPVQPQRMPSKGVEAGADYAIGGHEGLAPIDPYAMSAQERSKYQLLFPKYDADHDGYITGEEAYRLFSLSGLAREQLRQIWDLSDADGDNKLSVAEFCVGMHLIVCAAKKHLAVPTTVPRSLEKILGRSPIEAPSPSFFQSPARPSPSVRPSSTPPAASGFSSLSAAGTDRGDAFSELSPDLLIKDPAFSVRSEAEANTALIAPKPDQLSSPIIPDPPATPSQPQDKFTWRPSTETSATGHNVSRTVLSDTGRDRAPLVRPPPRLQGAVATDKEVASVHAQSSSANQIGAAIQALQVEKASMGSMVEVGKVEQTDNEIRLRDMGVELESLQSELADLRTQFQEQQKETAKLRESVTQAAIKRGTLLAEIEACKTALDVQEGETNFLRREEKMIEGTRSALLAYKATLKQDNSLPDSGAPSLLQTNGTRSACSVSSDRLPLPPPSEEAERMAPLEPTMPTRKPPTPPERMSSPRVVEDPFAKMARSEGVKHDKELIVSQPNVGSPGRSVDQSRDQKTESGFDAFTQDAEPFEADPFTIKGRGADDGAVADPFDDEQNNSGFDAFTQVGKPLETDPFVKGLGADGASDGGGDDPFVPTNAAFANATGAASDGFDAFHTSSETHFDAFGQ